MPAEPRSQPVGRRILASLALAVLLISLPEATVLEDERPPTRGDVMYMLHAPRLPEEIKNVALMAQTAPAALDLAGLPRAPAEPKNVPVPVPGQAKGVLLGGQSDRHRFRGRRSRSRRSRSRRRNR